MKTKVFILFVFIILLSGTSSLAEIEPFDFSFAVPTAEDLTKEEAENIADAYFSSHSKRILYYHEDIAQYEKATNFIRIVQNGDPLYCWVVAYNTGKGTMYDMGFAGMVIISSPDARIVDYTSASYFEALGAWDKSALLTDHLSPAEITAMVDAIALPEGNRVKSIMPDLNSIREEEALKIANRLIAGYQNITEDDVRFLFDYTPYLNQDLLVSDYPFWHINYWRILDSYSESSTQQRQYKYTITIYAHTGTVWYVLEHPSEQILYADLSWCNLPLSEESFPSGEWEFTDYPLLFGEQ